VRRARCQNCGARLSSKARFCPECGTAVASGDTVVQDSPPTEDGPTPVEPHFAERRYFGVPPSGVLLALGVVGVIAAIALFATGLWPWALIALGLALFLLTGWVSEERRSPGEPGNASFGALAAARSRAGLAKETIAAHGGARIELVRLRRETSGLARERSDRARELGEAVYAKNTTATKELKQRMKEIDDQIEAREAQMAQVTIDAQDRVGRARLQTQPTQVVAGDMPDEAPEPYPPPDEGDRPEPPEIPEPGPNTDSK